MSLAERSCRLRLLLLRLAEWRAIERSGRVRLLLGRKGGGRERLLLLRGEGGRRERPGRLRMVLLLLLRGERRQLLKVLREGLLSGRSSRARRHHALTEGVPSRHLRLHVARRLRLQEMLPAKRARRCWSSAK